MSRRRLVAIASAGAIFGIALLVAMVFLSATQTNFGRERVRRYLAAQVASKLGDRGSMYIGRIRGGLLTGVTVDSFAIRDDEDSLFISTGPVEITYDPRDLIDNRLLIQKLVVQRPFVNLRRHANRDWNYRRIFPKGKGRARGAERGFGDFIVIDTAVLRDGSITVTMPWHPDDSLTGARRDSAVRYALASDVHEIRRTREGLAKTWRWTKLDLESPYVRIADPDSAGRLIAIGRMDVLETDPPFAFRNIAGPVRILGDTVWFDVKHWDLPASTGTARGNVMWGFAGPVRYDVHVVGDSVALDDVNWVYPTLPRTGGGSMELDIRNDRRDPRVIDYALSHMDVRSTKSHLRGAMTFGVGGPVLVVKDVALEASPVDFDLFRTLHGGPFPVDWQGEIEGTVRARGGPLNRWVVDDARITFRDKHVRGAVTRGVARGGLDILFPAYTAFRGLDVDIETLDLRTPQYLFPNFPRLAGTISGSATLDSSWLDVRFRDADITHNDGPGTPSRFTGSGRVTYGDLMRFDVDLDAEPVSFTMLARSYPAIQFRGAYSGPMRVRGTMGDLDLAASLTGPAGAMTVDGRFDFLPPSFAARAQGRVENLDVRTLLARDDLQPTRLNGTFAAEVRGDSLINLDGTVAADLGRSSIGDVRVRSSLARLAFDDGRLRVDTLRVETYAATLIAAGAIGLEPSRPDTLRYTVQVDSLGGLRPYLRPGSAEPPVATLAAGHSSPPAASMLDSADSAPNDSLAGALTLAGGLVGSLDALSTFGTLRGDGLVMGGSRARVVGGEYSFTDLLEAPAGQAAVSLDTVELAGVRLSKASLRLNVRDRTSGRLAVELTSETGPLATASLGYMLAADTTHLVIDSVRADIRDRVWSLSAPAHVRLEPGGIALDSLVVRAPNGGRIALSGTLPTERLIAASLAIDSLPLADVGALAQIKKPLGGMLSLGLLVGGTRAAPVIDIAITADTARYGDARFPRFDANARYSGQELKADLRLVRDGKAVIAATGQFPVDLALLPVKERLLGDSLRARVVADNVDLAVLEPMVPGVQAAVGRMSTSVEVSGSWKRPTLAGRFAIMNGQMGLSSLGIRVSDVNADLAFTRDSIHVRNLSASSGAQRGNFARLSGVVRFSERGDRLYQRASYELDLSARDFEVIRHRQLADLEMSGGLALRGGYRGSLLTGGLVIRSGSLYLQERTRKQFVDLEALADDEFFDIVDTSAFARHGDFRRQSTWTDTLVSNMTASNVRIGIGDDVWLRSAEANIKLGGSVNVTRQGDRLALDGTLSANRGTYRLNLNVVQRTFEVQRGSITFFGGPVIDPALDITAVHTVRQANQGQDVRIRATIGGTLLQPKLILSSDERIQISETQVLSYLVSGGPSFAAGPDNNNRELRAVASSILPTLGVLAERALADQLGFFDLFELQTGRADDPTDALGLLSTSRIGIGKQLTERTFLSANAGLCTIAGRSGEQRFFESVGFALEHRLNYNFSVQIISEPASSALRCNTPGGEFHKSRQFGFDLFREWSF